jgi:hypothetical protein
VGRRVGRREEQGGKHKRGRDEGRRARLGNEERRVERGRIARKGEGITIEREPNQRGRK